VNGVELAFDGSDPYAAEAQHFAECVSLRRTPVVDAVEGLRNVQLLERIIAAGRIDQVDAKA
jgi:predicted dehydrogenase